MRLGQVRPCVLTDAQRAELGPPESHEPLLLWTLGRLPDHAKDRATFDDLKQAGWVGLLNAYRLFDPARGVKFTTFAVHKMRWAMLIEAGLTRRGWAPLAARYDDNRRYSA